MRGIVRGAIVAIALVCVAWGVVLAEEPPEQPEHEISLVVLEVEPFTVTTVDQLVVHRGRYVLYTVTGGIAYFAFPDDRLVVSVDGETKVSANGMTAFAVPDGSRAHVRVPSDYPDPGHDVVITYSIIACAGEGEGIRCDYVHKPTSPPDIIVPPQGPLT